MNGTIIIIGILLFAGWCWLLQTLFHVKYRTRIAADQTELLELIARKLGATNEEIEKTIHNKE